MASLVQFNFQGRFVRLAAAELLSLPLITAMLGQQRAKGGQRLAFGG
jgi:hypothetical protein